MFKKSDKVFKISNIFFVFVAVMSLLSLLSLLISGYKEVEGSTISTYYINISMFITYLLSSIIILYISNKKIEFYKDDYPLSRKIFNIFFLILCLSIVVMLSTIIFSKIFLNIFSMYSLLSVVFGYIPIYAVSYYIINKNELLTINNDKKTNIGNLIILFLLMNYSLNVIVLVFQMIFEINDIMVIISSLCISFIWIFIVLIAYNLINKKA